MTETRFQGFGLASIAIAGLVSSCAQSDRTTETPAQTAAVKAPRTVTAEAVTIDIAGPSWVLPRGITSFGAASTADAIYVAGGYSGPPHEYSSAGQSEDFLRMSLKTGTWERLGTIPKAQSVALAVDGQGRLFRIGGMQARNSPGRPADLHSLADAEVFDPKASTWTGLPALPAARSSHDAIVIGNSVWVAGGWTLAGEKKTWATTAISLDLTNPAAGWSEVDAPFRRRALATTTLGGKLVVIGGITEQRKISTGVDIFDPATEQWSKGPDFPEPGFGVAAVSLKDVIYASGMNGVVYRWATGETEWKRVDTLAYPRFFHRLVPGPDGDLIALGGIRAMESATRVRPIERLDPAGSDKPTILRYELASPLASKNRQGAAVVGDSLFLFGGNKSLGQHDFGAEFFTDQGAALDLASLTWTPIAPYPEKRQTMSTFVSAEGEIISVGGFGHDGEVARSHPEIFAYHPKKNTWRPSGTLPGQGRTQFGLAVGKDTVTLFGGLDYDPRRPKDDQFRHELGLLSASVSPTKFDFETSAQKLREPRRAFAGAILGDRYYVIGGMKEGFQLVSTCEAYDFATEAWTSVACPSRSRLSAQMVPLGDKLYLAAGSSRVEEGGKLRPDPSLEVYDPKTNQWKTVAERLPIEPKHVQMHAYGDRLVLVSTHNEAGRVDVVLVDPN